MDYGGQFLVCILLPVLKKEGIIEHSHTALLILVLG